MTTIVERIGTLSVGRVETVTAEELRIALFNETPQATALNTGMPTGFPRVNAYMLIPNETGAVVAIIKEIAIIRAKPIAGKQDDALVDLPFPARTVIAIPFGTLLREGNDEDSQPLYALGARRIKIDTSPFMPWSAACRFCRQLAIPSFFRPQRSCVLSLKPKPMTGWFRSAQPRSRAMPVSGFIPTSSLVATLPFSATRAAASLAR